MRSNRTFLVFVLVLVGMLTSACAGGSSRSAPTPSTAPATSAVDGAQAPIDEDEWVTHDSEPETAWQEITDEVTDGEIDVATAVNAFSLAVAPLPGSSEPRSGEGEEMPDASVAVAWVIRHHDELSDEQRSVVADVLSPVEDTAPTDGSATPGAGDPVRRGVHGRGRPSAAQTSTTGCYGQRVHTADSPGAEPFRARLDPIAADLQARLGPAMAMVAPVYLQVDDRELGLGRAYTWGDPGDCNSNGLATCTIHLSPRAQRAEDAELTGILAHEMMHCLVFQRLGMTTYDLPAWVGEGLPAWVGETVAGGTRLSGDWWDEYLRDPSAPLYGRDYDAIGFFAHLTESGVDVWSRAVPILEGFENEPAFEAAWADSSTFLESWPSGALRSPDRGSAWDTTGPGITAEAARPVEVSLADGATVTRRVGTVAGVLLRPVTSADRVTISIDGHGRLSSEDGDQAIDGSIELCVRPGSCGCTGGDDLPVLGDGAVLGVTGGTREAAVTFAASAASDDGCDEEGADGAGNAVVDDCMVGTWRSYAMANKDTTTSMPVVYRGGGEEVVLTIRADGRFTLDYDDSTPVVTEVGGVEMGTTTRGVAHGRLTASNGAFTVLEQDYATALTSTFVGAPAGGGARAGAIGIPSGTYECDAHHSLDTTSPTKLGEFVALWEAT